MQGPGWIAQLFITIFYFQINELSNFDIDVTGFRPIPPCVAGFVEFHRRTGACAADV